MSVKLKKSCDPAKAEISDLISRIIASQCPDAKADLEKIDIFDLLEQPPESNMGDYAMPCFRFAKILRKKPQDIAEGLKTDLENSNSDWIDSIKVVGAFLNFFTDKKTLANKVIPDVISGEYFKTFANHSNHSETNVMIEFSQPNTHKEFHVGHGRNVCLGDSLCRLFKYNDFNVLAVNYIGDEGTHIAKCLWQMENYGESVPAVNKSEWYGKRYVEANQKLDNANEEDKKKYYEEVSTVLKAIENKEGKHYQTWKTSREECLVDFKKTYEWLDVEFDHYFFESEFSQISQEIVDEYLEKGFFEKSEGAIGRDLTDSKLGFCMVRKSDGNIPYITRDIALARKKFEEFKINRSVYVVGSEQIYHFSQLFKILEEMGFEQAASCFHLSYGMVVRPEGKMSSRKGNSVTFGKLRSQMTAELGEHLKRYEDDWPKEEIEEAAHRLSVGAIKYGMLQSDPNREITFELKDWLSFEGNTGPYLMYTYARSRSIIRKAKEANHEPSTKNLGLLTHSTEAEILRSIYDLNNVCFQACENYRPSILSQHLFSMCKSFNRFYAEVSILKAESAKIIEARLALLDAFGLNLHKGLELLGMTPPERM